MQLFNRPSPVNQQATFLVSVVSSGDKASAAWNLSPDQFTAAAVFKLDFPSAQEAERQGAQCTKTDLSPYTPAADRLTHTHIRSQNLLSQDQSKL